MQFTDRLIKIFYDSYYKYMMRKVQLLLCLVSLLHLNPEVPFLAQYGVKFYLNSN